MIVKVDRDELGPSVLPAVSKQAAAAEKWPHNWVESLSRHANAPVDISFLVLFRIVFSAAMLWTTWDFFTGDQIAADYIRPPFHFTYYGFSWVRPWAGSGMYLHFGAMLMFAAFVGIGFLYRLSATLLFLSFTYVFLLEKALYLNHYYLMCLLCFIQIFLPANRLLAIDSLLRPSLRTEYVPIWTLWLLRFHLALPYFMGGNAKLNYDWMRGQPMYSWLAIAPLRYLIGPIVAQYWVALLFSWTGAAFDLAIVPLLLWKRTRKIAFLFVVVFHATNAFLFNIGVFPWLMIGATLVFFPPDWARSLLGSNTPPVPPRSLKARSVPLRQKILCSVVLLYIMGHVLLPFRHLLYPGNVLWTEEGQLFAWHMMLRTKVTGVQIIVAEPESGQIEHPDIMQWLTARQFDEMTHDPEMMREFAHYVRDRYAAAGRGGVEVHFVAICSLNGRKPQLLVDPMVDLARQPRTCLHKSWIEPLTELFRREPWNVPVSEWQSQISVLRPTHAVQPSRGSQ